MDDVYDVLSGMFRLVGRRYASHQEMFAIEEFWKMIETRMDDIKRTSTVMGLPALGVIRDTCLHTFRAFYRRFKITPTIWMRDRAIKRAVIEVNAKIAELTFRASQRSFHLLQRVCGQAQAMVLAQEESMIRQVEMKMPAPHIDLPPHPSPAQIHQALALSCARSTAEILRLTDRTSAMGMQLRAFCNLRSSERVFNWAYGHLPKPLPGRSMTTRNDKEHDEPSE
jgi:hypothetical protein